MISDSYMDSLEKKSQESKIPFKRNILEGKNYIELVKDIKSNDYDLVIIGVLGLGEVNGNLIGSVCERVVRRINTDVLIVKNYKPLEGRVIVTVDGSEQSFRAVEMASELAAKYDLEIELLSVLILITIGLPLMVLPKSSPVKWVRCLNRKSRRSCMKMS